MRAGLRPVGLKCTLCGPWQIDVGHLAVTPTCERTCPACNGTFHSAIPVVAYPLSLLQPELSGTHLTFLSALLAHVSTAFKGMDHLTEDSGLTNIAAATKFLHTLGVEARGNVDVLRGAQKLKIVFSLTATQSMLALTKPQHHSIGKWCLTIKTLWPQAWLI